MASDRPAGSPPQLALFGADAVFHHVGIAVRSIDAAGGPTLARTEDPTQRVSVAFVDSGGAVLELIEPLGDRSPVAASLAKGQPLVHLCFSVPDLDAAVVAGKRAGFHRLAAPVAAPAFGNRQIVWMFSRTFGLVELLERPARDEAAP